MIVVLPLLLLTGSAVLPADATCRVLIVRKQAGEAVFDEDLAPAPCSADPVPLALRYDRQRRVTTARLDLAEGAALGRTFATTKPGVVAGAPVSILARIGHVAVALDATALQTAHPGQRFFVRTAAGTIFVAPAFDAGTKDGQ